MSSGKITLKRGQIWWLNWEPGRGSEQQGTRPALIIQCNGFNRSERYTNTIVAAITTSAHEVPVHVAITPERSNGLRSLSFVLCEQIITVSRDRLDGYIGELDEDTMRKVDTALKRILELR